jgi:hypothetical protein
VEPTIRPSTPADLEWAEGIVDAGFGGRVQARLGATIDVLACDGLVAERDGQRRGLVTYIDSGGDVELALLVAVERAAGVGTALVDAVAQRTDARRVWFVTTNDNLDALRFAQRRGFRIAEVRVGAVGEARRTLKPGIPELGELGIPIRDEIVLERRHR